VDRGERAGELYDRASAQLAEGRGHRVQGPSPAEANDGVLLHDFEEEVGCYPAKLGPKGFDRFVRCVDDDGLAETIGVANIAALQARLGTTTLYVTHDQVEAMTMGHRVAVLEDGLLQQCDTPRALYDRPDNVFVAGFIGSPAMNLKAVPLTEGGALMGDYVVPLARSIVSAASHSGASTVTLGFRPEALRVAGQGEGFPLRVDLVEELGADAYVYGTSQLGDTEQQVVVRVSAGQEPEIGDTIYLSINPEEIHVFHPETGARLGD
jgi:multiple sugar transport system ATP-binding protein